MIDLDTLDNGAMADIMSAIETEKEFKFMIGHIIGIDSACHVNYVQHPHVSGKIRDTDALLRKLVEKLDD